MPGLELPAALADREPQLARCVPGMERVEGREAVAALGAGIHITAAAPLAGVMAGGAKPAGGRRPLLRAALLSLAFHLGALGGFRSWEPAPLPVSGPQQPPIRAMLWVSPAAAAPAPEQPPAAAEAPPAPPETVPELEPVAAPTETDPLPVPTSQPEPKSEPKPPPVPKPKPQSKPKAKTRSQAKVPPLVQEPPATAAPASTTTAAATELPTAPPIPAIPDGRQAAEERARFLARLLAEVERQKFYPMQARRRTIEGTVVVSFLLHPGGRVEGLNVAGNPILARAAQEAVERAQPLPEPPQGAELPLKVEFRMSFRLE